MHPVLQFAASDHGIDDFMNDLQLEITIREPLSERFQANLVANREQLFQLFLDGDQSLLILFGSEALDTWEKIA